MYAWRSSTGSLFSFNAVRLGWQERCRRSRVRGPKSTDPGGPWISNHGPELDALLDRCADQAAPLRPGAVVIPDVRVAQQAGQHEPGVRRALADPAVGDHLFIVGDTLAAVDLAQLL